MRNGQTNNIEWVNQLLLSNPKRWNSKLIEEVFDTQEEAAIQQIPLIQGEGQNSRYWAFNSKGKYTVKSGYKTHWNAIMDQHRAEDQEYNQQFITMSQFK